MLQVFYAREGAIMYNLYRIWSIGTIICILGMIFPIVLFLIYVMFLPVFKNFLVLNNNIR